MPIAPSPAVLRAADLLTHLAQHPNRSFSVSDLARVAGIPRATCDAILQALAEKGLLLRRDDDLRYELGHRCIELGDAARAANLVMRAAAAEAEQLARANAACVGVSIRHGNETRTAEVFDFGPPFALRARVGLAISLVPPFGAVYVAWDKRDAEQWLGRAAGALDSNQRDRYQRALEAVRQRGYSVTVATERRPELAHALETLAISPDAAQARRDRDELIHEMMHSEYLAVDIAEGDMMRVSQLSAPIFDHGGRAVASILFLGPDYQLTSTELAGLGVQVVRAAARATANSGGRPPAKTAVTG